MDTQIQFYVYMLFTQCRFACVLCVSCTNGSRLVSISSCMLTGDMSVVNTATLLLHPVFTKLCICNTYAYISVKSKVSKQRIAVSINLAFTATGNSHAIWDHTVLLASRRWGESRLYPQLKQVLDLATPKGCKAELTYVT